MVGWCPRISMVSEYSRFCSSVVVFRDCGVKSFSVMWLLACVAISGAVFSASSMSVSQYSVGMRSLSS